MKSLREFLVVPRDFTQQPLEVGFNKTIVDKTKLKPMDMRL